MPIVFASPLATAPGASALLPRAMKWTGFDGSEWDLSATSGPMTMSSGVKGLHMPAFEVFNSSTPLVPGVDLTGYALPPRSVYWPLNFFSSSIDEWQAKYSGFFDSMHPVEVGVWTVGDGDSARTLPLTYQDDGSFSFGNDPFVMGWALIGVELLAPRPLWRGTPIRRRFFAEEPVDFIPDVPGEEYFPTPIATFATATIDNPGNEPSYLTWTVEGPQAEGLELGVAGATITVPFAVEEDSVLRIDTDPASQFATLDGVDCTAGLGFQIFAPVPARGTSPLTISLSGTGSVVAELVPLYWRAS